jgi:hypothetical protein
MLSPGARDAIGREDALRLLAELDDVQGRLDNLKRRLRELRQAHGVGGQSTIEGGSPSSDPRCGDDGLPSLVALHTPAFPFTHEGDPRSAPGAYDSTSSNGTAPSRWRGQTRGEAVLVPPGPAPLGDGGPPAADSMEPQPKRGIGSRQTRARQSEVELPANGVVLHPQVG